MAERERKDKKEKKHKRRSPAVAVLAEEDMPEAAPVRPSGPSTPSKDALDINLNDISPLEQLQHRQHRQVTESPKTPTAQPVTVAAASSQAAASSSKSKDKKESRHKHKDKKHKHRSSSSSSDMVRTLHKESGFTVTYEHAVSDVPRRLVTTKLTFKNKTKFPIFGVELDLNDAQLPIRWTRSSPGPQSFKLNLSAGASDSTALVWNVANCAQPLKISGKLSFVLQKEADRAGVPVTINVDLIVPCSAYLVKPSIDQPGFVQLLRGPLAQPISTTALNNTVPKVLEFLSKNMNMFTVEGSQTRGSLYSKTLLGHDIAVLVKEEGAADSLALAVKASDEVLGQSLLREIASLCSKH